MDPAGRITSIKGVTLEYDKRGRVIAVRRHSGTDTLVDRFRYDERHRRYARFKEMNGAPSGNEFYAYEGDDLIAVLNDGGALRESYLFDGIDHPLRLKRSGGSTYYELDLASNVRRLRGTGGADAGGYRYSAFGLSRLNDPATPAPTVDQPLRWKGRWFEGHSVDLYDVRARWWNPTNATFLTIDELAYQDPTGTLWTWPGQNPIALTDPAGRGVPLLLLGAGFTILAMGAAAPSDSAQAPPDPLQMAAAVPGVGAAAGRLVGQLVRWAAEGLTALRGAVSLGRGAKVVCPPSPPALPRPPAQPYVIGSGRGAPPRTHGPYIHGINKGGLDAIIREQQMIATDARGVAGGVPAVRAYTHSLDGLGAYPSTDFLEFTTAAPPSGVNPGQSSVWWSMEEGARLDIRITRIAHPDGSVTILELE
jgi:RHS repeat-associated protein